MTPVEICLIIVAVILFVGSFFVTEKLSNKEIDEIKGMSSKELQRILENDLSNVEQKVKEILDGYVEETVDNASIPLGKITNEKIMAINEYSDNVLEEINKTHSEVMFLYSMLNDKQDEMKNMTVVIDKSKQHLKQMLIELSEINDRQIALEKETTRDNEESVAEANVEELEYIDEQISDAKTDSANIINNNEMILQMYDEGKSAVDIAKELAIGLGEVQLVISLFRGEE